MAQLYFTPERLGETIERVERLVPLPEGVDLPELALRFILEDPAVSCTYPACAASNMWSGISP